MAINWIGENMTKTAQELAAIARDLGLTGRGEVWPLHVNRLRPGHWGRSAGAWSWSLDDDEGRTIMGSPDPAKMVIAASKAKTMTIAEGPGQSRTVPTLYA